jgi:hypothetical protein
MGAGLDITTILAPNSANGASVLGRQILGFSPVADRPRFDDAGEMPHEMSHWLRRLAVSAVVVPTVVLPAVIASAEPSQVVVTYQVIASRLPRMCVGTDEKFTVEVDRLLVTPSTPALEMHDAPIPVRDVVLDATSSDPSVASIAHPVQIVGLDGSQPPVAEFTVHGEADGTTTIQVHANISAMAETDLWQGDTRDQTIPVAVVVTNCRFVLNTVSLWKIPGEANIQVGATLENAVLEPNEEGVYRQLAPVTWYLSLSGVGDCLGTISAPSTDAAIYAQIGGDGLLDVEVKFDPVTVTVTVQCGTSGEVKQVQQAEPLVFVVSTKGGGKVQAHALSGQAGRTRWTVEPVKDAP